MTSPQRKGASTLTAALAGFVVLTVGAAITFVGFAAHASPSDLAVDQRCGVGGLQGQDQRRQRVAGRVEADRSAGHVGLRRDGRGPLGTLPLGAAPRRLHPGVHPVLVATHAGAEPADLVVHGTTATVLLGDEQ